MIRDVSQVEVVAGDRADLPVVLDLGVLMPELLSKLLGEELVYWAVIGVVEKRMGLVF